MKYRFNNVKISSMSVVVPKDEICIYDEAQYYNNSIKKIDRMRKMVGFYKRRVADKTTTPSDMAICAAKNLFNEFGIDKNSIDALVYVCQLPDYSSPATAYFIHQKLGLTDDCIATDINQGCAGWVFGLFMVSQMIQSGTFKKVLLLNADTPSPNMDIADRNITPIFGDGGCATLLEYSEEINPQYFNIETKSEGFDTIIGPSSGERFRYNLNNDDDFKLIKELREEKLETPTGNITNLLGGYIDGIAVFDFTINVVPKNINELLDYAKLTKEDVPMLCLHQANKQIVQQVASIAGFDIDKAPYTAFENYGNNTMCSIPTTISLLDKNISKNNLCVSGFGNGLVCASAILNMEKTKITDIKEYVKPDYYQTRDEYINYWRLKINGSSVEEG